MAWPLVVAGVGAGLQGLGQIYGGDGSSSPYMSRDVWYNRLHSLDALKTMFMSGQTPESMQIFGGEQGQQYLEALESMMSGKASQDIGTGIQRQMAPQLSAQIDRLNASLNPALRGTGIGAQMGNQLRTQSNVGLADALANLQGQFFQQGTGMLGQAQTAQTGMNLQGLMTLQQLIAQMASVGKSGETTGWDFDTEISGKDLAAIAALF